MPPFSTAEWEELCSRFIVAREARHGRFEPPDVARTSAAAERSICEAAAPLLEQLDREGRACIQRALDHHQGRWFVAGVLRQARVVPHTLFPLLVRAAIDVGDPSWNRAFVDPCIKAFGAGETAGALLKYVEGGSTEEKLSAASALYWVTADVASLTFGPGAQGRALADATAESRERYASFAEVRRDICLGLLHAFIANEAPEFRRLFVEMLFVPAHDQLSRDVVDALDEARRIGQVHPDEQTRRVASRKLGL